MLLNICVETVILFPQDPLMNRKFNRTAFIWNKNVLQYYKRLYFHLWSIESISAK